MSIQEKESETKPVEIPNEEYLELTPEEQQRLNEYNNSIQGIEQARGRRILFEEAPSETLPFIVYCLYVSANALGAILVLYGYNGTKWPFFVLIGVSMIAPLLALPSGSLSATLSWLRRFFSLNRQS